MRMCKLFIASCVVAVLSTSVAGKDYFLTIGGGYSPMGNQVSLEKNVLLFQQLLADAFPAGVSHDVLFSDGNDPGRDLQFMDPSFEVPKAREYIARTFRQTKYLNYQYRDHAIDKVRDGARRASIERWFKEVGGKLAAGDRLFIYVTAHGGSSADKKQPYNTRLYLWNGESIQMKELAAHLDKLPKDVRVATVMVQCHAGGFANLIFNEGDAKKGTSAANRCGFFATTHDRVAAGCTPDINEENYQEYSSYFWEAIRGQTRTGKPIAKPDYNKDGAVSFDEAHAYALLASPSIDISIKTSDAFLRAFSKTQVKDKPDLVTADSAFDKLTALATPSERAVMLGLSEQLKLSGQQRAKAAKAMADKLIKVKRQLDGEYKKKSTEYSRLCGSLKKALINRWPELSNPWHPAAADILSKQSEAIVELVESHASFAKFESLYRERNELSEKKLDLDRRWVKCQRLIRTLENVALAANLPHVATEEIVKRFQQLSDAESGSLAPGQAGTVAATGTKNTGD